MRGSPTLETLAIFAVVFALQQALALLLGNPFLFALAPPLSAQPWTLVTSVYAHSGIAHLVSNAVALLVVGLALERATTRPRFHAFFVVTGAASGAAHVALTGLLGQPSAVLGASGAVFALLGYVLATNRLSGAILDRLPDGPWPKIGLLVALATLVTLATGAPGVALIAHFTGFALGLVAGRLGVLSTPAETGRSRNASY